MIYLISLGIDLYHATHPELPAHVIIQPAKAASDLILSFSWLIATTLLFFISALVSDEVPAARHIKPIPSSLVAYWVIALLGETIPLYNWIVLYAIRQYLVGIDYVYFGLFVARYLFLVGILVAALSYLISEHRSGGRSSVADSEGGFARSGGRSRQSSDSPQGGWNDILGKIRKLFPFLWPSDSLYLQFLVVACLALLALGRVVNVLVPFNYKAVVDALTPGGTDEAGDKRPYFGRMGNSRCLMRSLLMNTLVHIAWGLILIFVSLRFLQGGVGILSSLQSYLWIPVGQVRATLHNTTSFCAIV